MCTAKGAHSCGYNLLFNLPTALTALSNMATTCSYALTLRWLTQHIWEERERNIELSPTFRPLETKLARVYKCPWCCNQRKTC